MITAPMCSLLSHLRTLLTLEFLMPKIYLFVSSIMGENSTSDQAAQLKYKFIA